MTEIKTPAETLSAMERIGEWKFKPNEISRTYKFASFMEAIDFVGRIAAHSEKEDHHPDILIHYRNVTLTITTHSHSGVTDKDLAWAQSAEGIYGQRSKE